MWKALSTLAIIVTCILLPDNVSRGIEVQTKGGCSRWPCTGGYGGGGSSGGCSGYGCGGM